MAGMRPTARTIIIILVLTVVEVVWAVLCGETQASLILFYVGLIVASAVFFVPGVLQAETRGSAVRKATAETDR